MPLGLLCRWSRTTAWLSCCALAWADADARIFYVAVGVAITLLLLPVRGGRV